MEILPFLSDGDPSRLEIRWHVGSLKLGSLGHDVVRQLEGMGRIDVSLRSITPHLFDGMFESASWDAGILIDYETLSSLWVMGCYQLLRTMDDERRAAGAHDEKLKALKQSFGRSPVSVSMSDRVELADRLLDYLDGLPHTPASQSIEARWFPKAS